MWHVGSPAVSMPSWRHCFAMRAGKLPDGASRPTPLTSSRPGRPDSASDATSVRLGVTGLAQQRQRFDAAALDVGIWAQPSRPCGRWLTSFVGRHTKAVDPRLLRSAWGGLADRSPTPSGGPNQAVALGSRTYWPVGKRQLMRPQTIWSAPDFSVERAHAARVGRSQWRRAASVHQGAGRCERLFACRAWYLPCPVRQALGRASARGRIDLPELEIASSIMRLA